MSSLLYVLDHPVVETKGKVGVRMESNKEMEASSVVEEEGKGVELLPSCL